MTFYYMQHLSDIEYLETIAEMVEIIMESDNDRFDEQFRMYIYGRPHLKKQIWSAIIAYTITKGGK